MHCIDDTYSEAKRVTDNEFNRLENSIRRLSPEPIKVSCPRLVDDAGTCYLTNGKEPLKCTHLIKKFERCLDSIVAEGAKRRHLDSIRRSKKPSHCKTD